MKKLLIILFILLTFYNYSHASASRDFDGVDDNIDMGANLDVTTGDFTICGWAKLDEADTVGEEDDQVAGKKAGSGASNAGYSLRQGSADTIAVRASDGTEQGISISTTDIDAAWYWVCGTWDGTANQTTLYVNGVQEDQDTTANVDSLTNALNYEVGDVDGAGTETVNGLLAYIMNDDTVLTVTQVNELMWRPCSVFVSSGTRLSGCWPIWGDSTEIDISGADVDGTVSGTTESTDGPPVMIGDASL